MKQFLLVSKSVGIFCLLAIWHATQYSAQRPLLRSATSVVILSSTISAPKFVDSSDKNPKNQPFGSELAISTLRHHAHARPTTKIRKRLKSLQPQPAFYRQGVAVKGT